MRSQKVVIGSRAAVSCIFVFVSFFCASSVASRELPRRSFLGVTAQPTPDDHVRVGKIIPDSPAARSALAVGDILLALNGTAITSVDGFLVGVRSSKSGDRLIYRVQRDGKDMDVEVVLGELP